ncbi:MAG: restriction endonuclease subunit S, partial [bacterium]|nr:restriction endonuclease subunit S [bacterium]
MTSWNTYELQDVCSRLSSGKGIKAKDISTAGLYPVFGGNGIRGYTDTCNFEGKCAVIGRQGANCGNVRYFSGKAYMTEHAVVACANDNHDTRFLAYLLGTMQLGRLSGQSAQPGLAVKTLGMQPVQVPDLLTQQQTASLLGAIDDKIAHNITINKNLEEQAKAIFKSWFV